MIHVTCQKCDRKFKAPDEYLGKTAKCPKCGAAIKMEPARAASCGKVGEPAVPPPPQVPVVETDTGQQPSPGSHRLLPWIAAGSGAAIVLGVAAILLVVTLRRNRPGGVEPDINIDVEIETEGERHQPPPAAPPDHENTDEVEEANPPADRTRTEDHARDEVPPERRPGTNPAGAGESFAGHFTVDLDATMAFNQSRGMGAFDAAAACASYGDTDMVITDNSIAVKNDWTDSAGEFEIIGKDGPRTTVGIARSTKGDLFRVDSQYALTPVETGHVVIQYISGMTYPAEKGRVYFLKRK